MSLAPCIADYIKWIGVFWLDDRANTPLGPEG